MEDLDDLFNEVAPHIKAVVSADSTPYGRGPQFDHARYNADIAAGFKICTRCGERRELFNFNKTKANKLGIKGECRPCEKVYNAAYLEANRARIQANDRAKHYTRKYGLDPVLSKVLSDPANRIAECPLCRQTEQLVLDHDHRTKAVRGLLCSSCNSMLGFANDSIDTLYEAIAYLRKHKGL